MPSLSLSHTTVGPTRRPRLPSLSRPSLSRHEISLISEQVTLILREIGSSKKKLAQMEKELLGCESIDLSKPNIPDELKVFLNWHQPQLGKDSRTGITEMVASVGHSCEKFVDLLSQYMNYKVNGPCPDDWTLGQRLILQGCEPLPRRRCFAKTVPKLGLFSFPLSLWKNASDKIFNWSGLGCKNLNCLNSKKLSKDCVGCFDLVNEFENQRFVRAGGLFWLANFYCATDEKRRALTRLIERFGYKSTRS